MWQIVVLIAAVAATAAWALSGSRLARGTALILWGASVMGLVDALASSLAGGELPELSIDSAALGVVLAVLAVALAALSEAFSRASRNSRAGSGKG